jgi:DNA topoisomerase-6 subunit B
MINLKLQIEEPKKKKCNYGKIKMSSIKEKFNQISPSEFFYSNRDLAGFSNPTRSLYTAVREFVENALDACDQKGILPDVHLTIKAVDPEKSDPKPYILTVKDNGPGIDAEHIPLAFGTVLYGSKFGLKQARGMFGLGATMAILYGQITTNKPVTVKSCADGQTQNQFEILLDIQKNKPVIVKHITKDAAKKGLSVSICLEGDYSKAGNKIRDYVYETSLITPYASITFDDPKGQKFSHPRFVKEIPPPPTIIRPHPHGIDVERIRRMIVESQFEIPTIDDTMIEKVRKDLGLSKKTLSFTSIMDKAKKKWKNLSRQVRVVIALMSFLKMDFEKLNKIRIEDLDIPNKKLFYWDFGDSQSKSVDMDPDSQYYKQLTNTVQGEPLTTFLTKRFQRIGPTTAVKFAEFAKFKPEKRMGTLTNQELVNLSDALQKFEDFMAPDSSCLAPLGAEPLEKGIKKFFNPDFTAVVQRPASAYSGFPFIIEMGIAYGGDIKSGGPHVYRYANRIPLLYDEGSDVVLKVVHDTDWGRYKIKGEPPFIIVSHICSTRIPYKTAGKENVADRQEIERELRLALQFLSRKLASFMSKRGQAEMAKKRANLYAKYIPMIAEFCTELSGKKKEPNFQKILDAEKAAQPKLIPEENEIENK